MYLLMLLKQKQHRKSQNGILIQLLDGLKCTAPPFSNTLVCDGDPFYLILPISEVMVTYVK